MILRGGEHLSDRKDVGNCCTSIFKGGSPETTVEQYTKAWVRLIDLMEKIKKETPGDDL